LIDRGLPMRLGIGYWHLREHGTGMGIRSLERL